MLHVHAARWKIQDAKNRQKFVICAPSHNFVGLYLRKWSTYWQSEKIVKQQYLPHMSSYYGELQPTDGWDLLAMASLRHPSRFQRISRLGFVTAATSLNGSQLNFAHCLAISCASTLYIHFRGLLLRNGILPGAKFTLRASLALSCIGSVTALQSSNGSQPNFEALSRGRTYIRLGGHHVGQWPTF